MFKEEPHTVVSQHTVNGVSETQEVEFSSLEEATIYARDLDCVVAEVYNNVTNQLVGEHK
jgi:hypothetical protein